MSQKRAVPNCLTYSDVDIPLRPKPDPKPPTLTLAKTDTKSVTTSQRLTAVDITEKFTAAALGVYITHMSFLLC